MSSRKNNAVTLLTTVSAAALVACGGGGGSDGGTTPPPVATQVKISGKAVDGALQGATACYDLNDNGACDSGEPTATSGADGSFSFDVDTAAAGKHRVVIEVPATAVDADTGAAVGIAFKLMSPATGTSGAQNVFASPLTTLVQAHMDATGATLAAATDLVKAQASLSVSPLADFTADTSAAGKQAATLARLVQLTTLKQGEALASVVGQVDLSGTPVTAKDLDKAVVQAIIAALPAVASEAADPALAALSGAALQSALANAASNVIAQAGAAPETVVANIGLSKLPPDASVETPTASATLAALRWSNPDNWYYRTLEASAADNAIDANGKVRYYEVRRQSESSGFSPSGTAYGWAFGVGAARQRAGDLHWNGSAWVGCTLGQRYLSTRRDAAGNSSYDYCDGYESGTSTRSALDVSGQSIATVVAEKIRTLPGGASGVAYSQWGPANLTDLGSAAFPTGSKLLYQSNTVTKTAIAYDVQASNIVFAQVPAVAAGGDARTTSGLACAAATLPAATEVTTLEDLIARNPGTPCIFNKSVVGADSSLDPNEWWSNATASLGILAGDVVLPEGTGNWYSADRRLRVAFSGTTATYYSCLSRSTNGSSRNCSVIGTGSYAIETLGDARVMTFSNLPAITQRTGFARVFVERGGKVWFGYRNPSGGTTPFLRLNLEATNGVFTALSGLPLVRPVTQYADMSAESKAVLGTMRGVWGQATDTEATLFRFGDNGRFLMGNASPLDTALREQTGGEVGWFEVDAATKKFRTLVEIDSNMTAGTSNPSAGELNNTLDVTPTQISVNGQVQFGRLPSQPTTLVGLWARGSATDLKTQHFAFFANGKVLMIDPLGDTSGGACTAARQGPPGGEYASYTFDAATGALRVFGKIYDTNGCAGLFDSSAGAVQAGTANTEVSFTVVIAPDGQTATATPVGGGTPSTLYRIASQ